MSTIHTIREESKTKLNAWEKQAVVIEAHLDHQKEDAVKSVETQKKHFRDALDQFTEKVDQSRVVAEEKKWKIKTKLEHLKVQLALGKAETKDALEEQKKNIKEAIASFESTLDEGIEEISEEFDETKSKLVEKANTVEAELEVLGLRLKGERKKWEAQLEERRQELLEKIQNFREDLKAKKHFAKDKAVALEKEISSGMSKIKDSFTNLFSK